MGMVVGALLIFWLALCMGLSVVFKPRCPACRRKSLVFVERPVSWVGLVDGITVVRCQSCGAKSECDRAGRWSIVDRT